MSDRDDEPTTIFQYEMRRRSLERQEGRISDDPPATPWAVPRLPASSPWHSDPCGDEPLINREEDASFINCEEDQSLNPEEEDS
jgi:hypothetical protein